MPHHCKCQKKKSKILRSPVNNETPANETPANNEIRNETQMNKDVYEKLDAIHNDLLQIKDSISNLQSQSNPMPTPITPVAPVPPQEEKNIISDIINGKKDELKKDITEFMLANCNINALDDKTEEQIYDLVIDGIWQLVVGKFL